MQVAIKVRGFKELDDALRALPERVQRNVMAGAVRAGAKIVTQAMIADAPVARKPHYYYPRTVAGKRSRRGSRSDRILIQPGLIKRSIRAWRSRSQVATVVYQIGPRKRGGGNEDPWYANFLEWGTSRVPATGFIRGASDRTASAQISAMREYLTERIPKEFLKQGIGG
jgi:HK97 gp10 family phage protein